jgi:hypothetical protein
MATETIRFDDLDYPEIRTPATETITFSFGDSGPMQLDLSADHAKELTGQFAAWIAAATPVTKGRPASGNRTTDAANVERLKGFRAWMAAQGTPVKRYENPNTGKPGGYQYPKDKLAEYDAHLATEK